MRILFVDDEPRVLEALERSLFELPPEWEVECLPGATQALARLAEQEFDVVVSDMRMPGMSGAELLRQISIDHPAIVRIILSGHTGEDQALGATPVAHQWLTKPCSSQSIVATVTRVNALRETVGPELRSAAGGIGQLASPPHLYAELQRVLNNSRGSVDMIVGVVEQDPAMCAKALQLANSSFFSRAGQANDVRAAVARIGMHVLQALALERGVFSRGNTGVRPEDLAAMQRLAMRRALLARLLAPKALRDTAFLAALLCDVGVQVAAVMKPAATRAALARVARGSALLDAELAEGLPAHALAGAYLLGLWGLPEAIVEAVTQHHEGRRPHPSALAVADVVHCAAALVEGFEPDAAVVAALGGEAWLENARREAEGMPS